MKCFYDPKKPLKEKNIYTQFSCGKQIKDKLRMNLILGRELSREIKSHLFAQSLSPIFAISGVASASKVLISYKLVESK